MIRQMVETADPEALIAAIEARPVIWDSFAEDYHDRLKTKQAWLEIGKIFFPEIETFSEEEQNSVAVLLQRKWRNMRDSYVKDLKQWSGGGGGGGGGRKRRKYIFFERLSFLRPGIEAKAAGISSGRVTLPLSQGSTRRRGSDRDSHSDDDVQQAEEIINFMDLGWSLWNSNEVTHDRRNKDSEFVEPKALISVIESTPQLWDPTHKDYMDRTKMKESWINVCKVFFPQYDDLHEADRIRIMTMFQKMWRNFRDCFVKDWRAAQIPTLRPLRRRKYIYYDNLSFLVKSIEHKLRRNPDYSTHDDPNNEHDDLSYPDYEGWFDGGSLFCDESQTGASRTPPGQSGELVQVKCEPESAAEETEPGAEAEHEGRVAESSRQAEPSVEAPPEANEAVSCSPPVLTSTSPPPSTMYPICSLSQGSPPPVPATSSHDQVHVVRLPEKVSSTSSQTIKAERGGPKLRRSWSKTRCHQDCFLSNFRDGRLQVDDDLAYFLSLLPAVRDLNEDKRLAFRIEVMRTLQRMKAEEGSPAQH